MKGKPTILIFIDWYLPGYKAGGPIQSCANLVEHLKEQANFFIITRNTDYCSDAPYQTVSTDNWNEVDGSEVYYISKAKLKYSKLRKLIREVEPDLVYINGIYSFYFSILPLLIAKQLRMNSIIVAARGMFASSAVQVKGFKKKLFFSSANFLRLYKGVTFQATNNEEKVAIQAKIGDMHRILIAPNLPRTQQNTKNFFKDKSKGYLHLVSIARVAPEKNTKYALEVLAAYKGTGIILFDIYGPIYDEVYWKECEALIAEMPQNVSVKYIGSLDSHLVPTTLEKYHALFMPSRGENFGHIILESLIGGCPVLISDQTPWKGLREKGVGYDLPLSDKKSFEQAIETFVNLEQGEYNCLSDNAFLYARSYVENDMNLKANQTLFNLT